MKKAVSKERQPFSQAETSAVKRFQPLQKKTGALPASIIYNRFTTNP